MEKLTELKIQVWTHSRMPDRQVQRVINTLAEVMTNMVESEQHDDETGVVNFKIYEV